MQLIDSHCHLDDDRFDERRDKVLRDASAAGIERIVVPATTAARWQKLKRVCAQQHGLFPAYGLHPWFTAEHTREHLDQLDAWLTREKPIALGECGLDFYDSRDNADWQVELFAAQLELASDHRLPVIVHARKALDEVVSLLRRQVAYGGVVHSFAGSEQQARQLYDLGFKLGIAATVSFERARKLRAVVAAMPDDALLLESDAPDQPGTDHRGELNQPAFIVEHLQVMAELRNTDPESLATTLNRNAEQLFGI